MGGSSSKAREQEEIDQLLESALSGGEKPEWANEDSLRSPKELSDSLKAAGVESCNLICAIDFTASNKTAGAASFGGRSLHTLGVRGGNPYEQALSIIGNTLSTMDEDNLIPAFGFGDQTSKSFGTRPLGQAPCRGFEGVLSEYRKALQRGIVLSGPTSFAPVIRKAVDLVKASGNELHVLLIIADGQVSEALDCKRETINAIVEASHVPLSIVVVGVGDGPFDQMETFDDQLPERRFDNLQFVDFQPFQAALAAAPSKEKQAAIEAAFALCALQELPSQFQEIVRLGQLGDGTTSDEPAADAARPPPPSDWWNTIWGSPPVVNNPGQPNPNPGPPPAAAAASAAAARARMAAVTGTKRQRTGPNRGGPSAYGGDGMRWMGGD